MWRGVSIFFFFFGKRFVRWLSLLNVISDHIYIVLFVVYNQSNWIENNEKSVIKNTFRMNEMGLLPFLFVYVLTITCYFFHYTRFFRCQKIVAQFWTTAKNWLLFLEMKCRLDDVKDLHCGFCFYCSYIPSKNCIISIFYITG